MRTVKWKVKWTVKWSVKWTVKWTVKWAVKWTVKPACVRARIFLPDQGRTVKLERLPSEATIGSLNGELRFRVARTPSGRSWGGWAPLFRPFFELAPGWT